MSAPTASRHHSDWLSLVEISGPFVSLPVLLRVFSQGLEPRDPTQAKALRAAYEEWQDNPAAPGQQRAWVLHVLTTVLGYPANQVVEGQALPAGLEAKMPEMGETLRSDFALIGPAGTDTSGKAQLLISSYPAEQKLDRPVIGKHWKATPATRMMELLHGAGVPLGLVTNGEQWMLVYAPRGEITGYISWFGALWLDEPITLRAFHSLLGVRRFFGVADDSTLLALLKESANDQQEVTDQLGFQVREAVEVLVQSFDALDKDSNRILLEGVSPTAQYEAALTIMMRLVFLFSAEERGLLHLGKPLYDNNYAVSTLQEQLQEIADLYGEEVLERRTDAWARLLSSFRAVHGGVKHQDLLMQAYGGSLFDPDRYPFLEGRAAGSLWRKTTAEPLGVNNRVVLHLLNSLQRLRMKSSAGGTAETRRISFRALGVEQIGHVYEGLLDHTGVLASEPVLGIKGPRNKEAEIPLSKLESLFAEGQDKLVEFLKETTGRSLSAIRKSLEDGSLLDEHKLLVACGHDQALLIRLLPFARLIREDSFERPLVVLTGSVYVTSGTDRRSSGTHYTPPTLTEPIVQHTLEPLVYQGPVDGLPREQWTLKSPKNILDLKVCDMAMGSGAFLVQVCRYLAERLVEAWENEEKLHPGQVLITPDGKFSEGSPSDRLVPAEAAERIAIARRVIADRCIYGVDINPMAVEMAKLSLWLITMDANRPFTFLDHAFKHGNSIQGITSIEQLENFSLKQSAGKLQGFSAAGFSQKILEATAKRESLEAMNSDTPDQVSAKAALYLEAEEAVKRLTYAANVLIAFESKGLNGKAYESEREATAEKIIALSSKNLLEFKNFSDKIFDNKFCFHWVLAFPEIIKRGGFDAFVGNPPFLGGKRISTLLGEDFHSWVKTFIGTTKGAADLCAYFFLRAESLLRKGGCLGLLATNTICQSDTRTVGLAQIEKSSSIYRANQSMPWPGVAGVDVAVIHIFNGVWNGDLYLGVQKVEFINSYLSEDTAAERPFRLNLPWYGTKGTYVHGEGFVLSNEEKLALVTANPINIECIKPYLVAQDFTSDNLQRPSRWVINFGNMTEEQAQSYPLLFKHLVETVKPKRDLITKQVHEKCFWKHWDRRDDLYNELKGLTHVIICPEVSKHCCFDFVSTDVLFSHRVNVIASESLALLALLQSEFHVSWAWKHGPTMRNAGICYTTSDCFYTFPSPEKLDDIERQGVDYHSCRREIMIMRNEGLTKTYNRFNDPAEASIDIQRLRELHVEVDQAVSSAYGWQDIALDHGFYETKQGTRYTVSEVARRDILGRLLMLNRQRHFEEEAERASHPVLVNIKRGRKPKVESGQITLDI